MASVYSPVYSQATGWIVGVIQDHSARPLTEAEVKEACNALINGAAKLAEVERLRFQVAALRELLGAVSATLTEHADKFAAEGRQSERNAEDNTGPGAAVELERAYVCNTAALRMKEVAALAQGQEVER